MSVAVEQNVCRHRPLDESVVVERRVFLRMLRLWVFFHVHLLQLSACLVCFSDLLRCELAEPGLERFVIPVFVLVGNVIVVLEGC